MNYGSRLALDDQENLFVNVGEHLEHPMRAMALAQDRNATWGKILRLNLDGSCPGTTPSPMKAGRPWV